MQPRWKTINLILNNNLVKWREHKYFYPWCILDQEFFLLRIVEYIYTCFNKTFLSSLIMNSKLPFNAIINHLQSHKDKEHSAIWRRSWEGKKKKEIDLRGRSVFLPSNRFALSFVLPKHLSMSLFNCIFCMYLSHSVLDSFKHKMWLFIIKNQNIVEI